MGKSTISMAIFNSDVSLPEGNDSVFQGPVVTWPPDFTQQIRWFLPIMRPNVDINVDPSLRFHREDVTYLENHHFLVR